MSEQVHIEGKMLPDVADLRGTEFRRFACPECGCVWTLPSYGLDEKGPFCVWHSGNYSWIDHSNERSAERWTQTVHVKAVVI